MAADAFQHSAFVSTNAWQEDASLEAASSTGTNLAYPDSPDAYPDLLYPGEDPATNLPPVGPCWPEFWIDEGGNLHPDERVVVTAGF